MTARGQPISVWLALGLPRLLAASLEAAGLAAPLPLLQFGRAEGEPHYGDLEQRLAAVPVITVLTMTLEGGARSVPRPGAGAHATRSTALYRWRIIGGGGVFNLLQEAPDAFTTVAVDSDDS